MWLFSRGGFHSQAWIATAAQFPKTERSGKVIKLRRLLGFGFLAAASIVGCGGGGGDPGNVGVPPLPTAQLVTNDLQAIISQAVTQAVHDRVDAVVAVSDREGNVLGVWDMKSLAQTKSPDGDGVN